MKQSTFNIIRIIKAIGYSLDGLKTAFANEAAFRQEVIAGVILFPLSLFLHTSREGHALLMGSLFLVLIAEITNSAIENAIDRVSKDIHPLSKNAKDLGSAIVLLALVNAAVIWAIILL